MNTIAHEVLFGLSTVNAHLDGSESMQPTVIGDPYLGDLSAAARSVLGKFQRIVKYQHITKHNIAQAHQSGSIIIRTICDVLQQHLQGFARQVVQIEKSLYKADMNNADELPTALQLTQDVFDLFSELIGHMYDLSKKVILLDDCTDPHAMAKILEDLRNGINTGFKSVLPMATELSMTADRLWVKQLVHWTIHGVPMSNDMRDFFVSISSHTEYGFLDAAVPEYLDKSLCRQFFHTGMLHKRIITASSDFDKARLSVKIANIIEPILNDLVFPIGNEGLRSALAVMSQSLCADIIQEILPSERVHHVFLEIHNIFLLEDGEFALALLESASKHFSTLPGRGFERIDNTVLALFLEKVFAKSSRQPNSTVNFEDHIYLSTLETNSDDLNDLLLGLGIELRYRVTPPLDLVLDREDVKVYAKCFTMLIAIHRGQFVASSSWLHRRHENIRATVAPRIWHAIFRAHFILGALLTYFHGHIIENFRQHMDNITGSHTSAFNPLMVSQLHREQLKALAHGLHVDVKPFKKSLRRLLQQIDVVVAALQQRRMENLNKLCMILNDLLDDSISALQEEMRAALDVKLRSWPCPDETLVQMDCEDSRSE